MCFKGCTTTLCDTLFHIPMKPVGPEVLVPEITDLEGVRRRGHWVEGRLSGPQGAAQALLQGEPLSLPAPREALNHVFIWYI